MLRVDAQRLHFLRYTFDCFRKLGQLAPVVIAAPRRALLLGVLCLWWRRQAGRPRILPLLALQIIVDLVDRDAFLAATELVFCLLVYLVGFQNRLALVEGVVADSGQCGGFLLGIETFVRFLTKVFPLASSPTPIGTPA